MLNPAAPINTLPVAVVDVETTGLRAETGDRVCEIAVLRVDAAGERTAIESLINPGRPIDPGASRVNGIRDEDVADAPAFGEYAEKVTELFAGAVLVAHNAPFDLSFLQAEMAIARVRLPRAPVVDTLALARSYFSFPRNDLGSLARNLRVETGGLHRAAADVKVTFAVYRKLMQRLAEYGLTTLNDVLEAHGEPQFLEPAAAAAHLPHPLDEAVRAGRPVAICYARASRQTERVVQPLWANRRYLIAYCHLRQAQRTFRIDRIVDAWWPSAD